MEKIAIPRRKITSVDSEAEARMVLGGRTVIFAPFHGLEDVVPSRMARIVEYEDMDTDETCKSSIPLTTTTLTTHHSGRESSSQTPTVQSGLRLSADNCCQNHQPTSHSVDRLR